MVVPKEDRYHVTKMSKEAFTYWHIGEPWDNKVIHFEDITQELLNSSTFKVMSSGGSYAVVVREQKTIEIPIDATDREGDELEVTVKGWMNTQEYTTTYDDAGEYTVTVIVSDAEFETKQTFKVSVLDKNRPPIFKVPA